MAVENIQIPDIGDEQEVEVIEILVSPGDEISENDSLIVLESEKAAMEIPSPVAGVVTAILVKVGDLVSQGNEIVSLETQSAGQEEQPKGDEPEANAASTQVQEPELEKEPESTIASVTNVEPPTTSASHILEVHVPDLGGDSDVEVIEILVSEGDQVNQEDGLVTLESEKAAMDVPSPATGKVVAIKVNIGDKVNEGTLILELESTADVESSQAETEEVAEETEVAAAEADNIEQVSTPSGEPVITEVKVPNLGEDSDVDVIEILVNVGDEIKKEDGLITLETEKAAMDVPSPSDGKVKAIKVNVGDKVSEGSVILDLETLATAVAMPVAKPAAATPAVSKPASVQQTAKSEPGSSTAAPVSSEEVYAGPAVRKMARELGVNLAQVTGSGARGRVVKEDVEAYVKGIMQGGAASGSASGPGLPGIEDIDFSQFGDIEVLEMSKLHQVTARNMTRNWLNVPHVTQFDEADITDLEEFRQAQKALAEKKGIKLSPLPFIVKACAQALQEYPQFNVSLHSSGTKMIQKKYVNIGVAVATPAGLMVPVITTVDRKSIWEIAEEIATLSEKAKDRKLTKEEMQGSCFTISSLGNIGGSGFTPIVNAPEVAILGVSKTTVKPVYIDDEFVPRKMLPFALSYDHRAVNGVDGGMFCTYLGTLLNDIRLLAL